MALNTPEFMVLTDDAKSATIKVLGYFGTAVTANFAFAANTLAFANTSRPCIASITNVLYSTSLANGRVSIEYVGTSNVKAHTFGHFNDGEMNKYVFNTAAAPTGDFNINVEQAGANDSFTIIFSVNKEVMGVPGNVGNYGAGAWANGFINT